MIAIDAMMRSIAIILSFTVVYAVRKWELSGFNNSFTIGSCDGKIKSLASEVPGLITTDLINAGIIKLDPYYRYEEVNMGWVPQNCWYYLSKQFELPNLDSGVDLFLKFEGIDSVASVFVNDVLVGKSANALRSHVFVVDSSLLLPSKKNVMKIELDDPLAYMKSQSSKYPYSVPETQNWNVWVEPSHRNFLRKAGSDMGWDWGPAYAPSGLTGAVYFYQEVQGIGKLDGIAVLQTFNEDMSSVSLEIKAQISSLPVNFARRSTPVPIKVLVNGQHKLSTSVTLGVNDNGIVLIGSVTIDNPILWWPVGNGGQYLYTIEVQYGSSSPQSVVRKVGLREVELVQEKVTTSSTTAETTIDGKLGLYTVEPTTFYFKINRQPVFMRGANFIPIDVFESRVTHADREYIMRAAIASNMNMLRVWGGGRYQPDDFYDLADELGMLVWQEVMLACALYPTDKVFLEEITAEVTEQAFRLGTHPSVVIWGGNNENEVALGWFPESNTNRDLYVADYNKLYGLTVYPALSAVIGSGNSAMAPWVDSSPSNGLISTEPYTKRWGQANTASAGDAHFYNYACDCEDYTSFPQSRFISEFGFQTMPSFLAYEPVSTAADWSQDSDLMLYRQRHENGNSEIESQLTKHFALPVTCPASESRTFDMYLYLTGLQQGRCYETSVNRWRQLRSQEAHTMGILYWQLNDIWQGPSWASLEWGGRWKPVQYAMKRAYAPVVVTLSAISAPHQPLEVYAVNDHLDSAVTVLVTVDLVPWDGQQSSITLWSGSQSVLSGSSLKLWSTSAIDSTLANGHNRDSFYIRCTSTSSKVNPDGTTTTTVLHPTFSFLTYMKDAKLVSKAAVTTSDFVQLSSTEVEFSLSVNATSPFLFLELKDDVTVLDGVEPVPSAQAAKKVVEGGVFAHNAGWFSDNNFLAEVGQVYRLKYTSYKYALSAVSLQRRLKSRVLQHAYDCELNM